MPGKTIIGDSRNADRNRPTTLPAEARSLSRFLRLLQSPEVAADALLGALSALSSSDSMQEAALKRVKDQVSNSIRDMRQVGWSSFADRYAEYNMALAVESVLQDPASFIPLGNNSKNSEATRSKRWTNQKRLSKGSVVEDDNSDDSSKIFPNNRRTAQSRAGGAPPSSPFSVSSLESGAKKKARETNAATINRQSAVIVSDSSSIELTEAGEEENQEEINNTQTQQGLADLLDGEDEELIRATATKYLWATLLESIHLQVASLTTKVWGRKKIYEVYQLARPVQSTPSSVQELSTIRQRLEKEVRSACEGIVCDASDCRVYTTLQSFPSNNTDKNCAPQQAMFVQFNLGKTMDLQDESNRSKSGEKKKKAGSEYVAIIIPGTTLFCLTASRAPSRARYTPSVLATLENVLTETTNNLAATAMKPAAAKQDLAVKRFGDLSGTEPHELLRSARSVATGEAVGRFAHMAASDQSNPISDLHNAATANLLETKTDSDANRLTLGARHAGNAQVAKVAEHVTAASEGGAALVATDQTGTNVWIDHALEQKQSRKRTREEALGRSRDCPSLQRVCWKWSGETAAASACWADDAKENESSSTTTKNFPKTKFKCAVVMQGENVLEGLQALVDAGLMEAPLPDFIKNAPSMGGTIRVENGSFVPGDTPFEAV